MAAPIYADRVKETTTTTGTGTLSLGGTVTGYQTFVNAIGNGNTTKIVIDDGNGNWELCLTVVASGTPATLTRGTLIGSSTGSRINFSAGTKTVAVVPAADWFTLPTRQVLTSGTAATYTTPSGCRQLRIRMVGGGGGGYGAGASGQTSGGDTSFNSIAAKGGSASSGADGGVGGTAGAGSASFRVPGGGGGAGPSTGTTIGGTGGSSAFGGGASGRNNNSGLSAAANSGGGGGGGAPLGGGGAGEYVEYIISSPAGTYTYTVGAKGNGGTAGAGFAGGDGGSGLIIVDEFY